MATKPTTSRASVRGKQTPAPQVEVTETVEEVATEQVEAETPAPVITHTVVAPDGTEHEVPVRNYPTEVKYDDRWSKGGDRLFGHYAGDYSDTKSPLVRELAYAWKASGQSVTKGYTALKLQCGAHLNSAAAAHAKEAKVASPAEARKTAIAARQAETVQVTAEDAAAIAPPVSVDA